VDQEKKDKEMRNIVITLVLFIVLIGSCYSQSIYELPVNITGKVMNADGLIVKAPVTVVFRTQHGVLDKWEQMPWLIPESKEERVEITDGVFKWSGVTESAVTVWAEKDGYYTTEVMISGHFNDKHQIEVNDLLIYLIPKGTTSSLMHTKDAYIPDIDEEKSGGKQCGWSFKMMWYYPVDEKDVDIILGVNEKDQYFYRMKSPGGFRPFGGFKEYESANEPVTCKIEYLTEAPEGGYVQDYIIDDQVGNIRGEYYCYFKTPDGKYGKMRFTGGMFDYYIQPDGSRNLEAGKLIDMYPINPYRLDK